MSDFSPQNTYGFREHLKDSKKKKMLFALTRQLAAQISKLFDTSVVCIVIRLQAEQSGVRIPVGGIHLSLLWKLWIPSILLFIGYRLSVAWLSWPGRDVDHSPPSSVKVKNEWSCTSVSPCTFMMWTGTTFPFHSYSFVRVSWHIRSSPPPQHSFS